MFEGKLLKHREFRHILTFILILLSIIPAGCAVNNKILMGSRASSYIGDLKERLAKRLYTVKEVRWRGSDDIIAFIFNTDGGGFEYISRLDDSIHFYSHIILDRVKEGKKVTGEYVQNYLKEIEKNRLRPFVIFDDKGEGKAIIFTKAGNQISSYINNNGHVTIEISDNLYLGRRLFQWRNNKSR